MRLLMCSPRYYGIEYEINPWMSRSRRHDPQAAEQQWSALCELLRERPGVQIELIEPEKGLPDMVFTANAGFVWGRKFISSNFRYEVRRGESAHFEAWFESRGYEVIRLPQEHFFEGEGDLLACGETLFAGYHIRSDILSHQRVAELLEREVLSLELSSEWFYHLDTCFCPLGPGRAIFYPGAFDRYALKVLSAHIPDLLEVGEEEARRFACNAVVMDKDMVMNSGCPTIAQRLAAKGYSVFSTPLDEFIKAGGSAKCLVLKIPHGNGV